MSPRRTEVIRRSSRWATAAALLALTPKCVLCVAAYVGLGSWFGLGASELCGAPAGSPGAWTPALAAPAIALGVVRWVAHVRRRSREQPAARPGCQHAA